MCRDIEEEIDANLPRCAFFSGEKLNVRWPGKNLCKSLDIVLEQRRHEVVVRPRENLGDVVYDGQQGLASKL